MQPTSAAPFGHDLCPTPALYPGEDAEGFGAMLARLMQEHAPRDTVAQALVRQTAVAIWRLERAERLEVEVFVTRERRVNRDYVMGYNPNSPLMWDARRMDTVIRYRAQAERGLQRALKMLGDWRGARKNDTHEPEAWPETWMDAANACDTHEPGTREPERGVRAAAKRGTDEPGHARDRHGRRRAAVLARSGTDEPEDRLEGPVPGFGRDVVREAIARLDLDRAAKG